MYTTTANRTIVITGADGSLGAAALKHYADSGNKVIASVYTAAEAERLRQFANQNKWQAEIHQLDLGSFEGCQTFADTVTNKYGPVDCVFNAAGGFRYTSVTQCSQSDFQFLFSANFISCWHLSKFFVPSMKAKGTGRLVYVSARKTQEAGQANFGIYTATKAALNAMVAGLADELKGSGVTVNLVAPSVIDTPANRDSMPDSDFKKWVTSSDILNAVDFLFSSEAAAINGSTITVAGGL